MNSNQTTETLGNMSVGASTSAGILAYIEAHSGLVALGISFAGFCAAIFFYWINYRLNKKHKREELKLKKREFELRKKQLEYKVKNE